MIDWPNDFELLDSASRSRNWTLDLRFIVRSIGIVTSGPYGPADLELQREISAHNTATASVSAKGGEKRNCSAKVNGAAHHPTVLLM